MTILGSNTVKIADGAGGIIGDCSSFTNYMMTISKCCVTGNYTIGQDISGLAGSGGICGASCISTTITNCYTTGHLASNDNVANGHGGLVGPLFSGTISNCFTTGNDNGSNSYAGNSLIVGSTNGDVTISNCYSVGLIGNLSSGILTVDSGSPAIFINNCYSTGNMGNYAGGICYMKSGVTGPTTILNCYSTGTLTSSTAGGIIGIDKDSPPLSSSIILRYCYALDAVGIGSVTGTYFAYDIYSRLPSDITKQLISQGASGNTEFLSSTGTSTLGFGGGTWGTPITNGYLINSITVNSISYSNIWLTNTNQVPPQVSETPYYLNVFVSSPWIAHTSNTDTSGFFVLVCYKKGTRILTNDGYVLIEELKINDIIPIFGDIKKYHCVTMYDESKNATIEWIGKCTIYNIKEKDYPICIKKNGISENVPENDLFVSQSHLIKYGEGFFKAIKLLKRLDENAFIDRQYDTLEYYHIATNGHHVIKCENVFSETLGDIGKRKTFLKNNIV